MHPYSTESEDSEQEWCDVTSETFSVELQPELLHLTVDTQNPCVAVYNADAVARFQDTMLPLQVYRTKADAGEIRFEREGNWIVEKRQNPFSRDHWQPVHKYPKRYDVEQILDFLRLEFERIEVISTVYTDDDIIELNTNEKS